MKPDEFINLLYESNNDEDENIDKILTWLESEVGPSIGSIVFSRMGLQLEGDQFMQCPEFKVSSEFRSAIMNADPSRMKMTASITILSYICNIETLKEERKIFYDKTLNYLTNELGIDSAKKNLVGLNK